MSASETSRLLTSDQNLAVAKLDICPHIHRKGFIFRLVD
jgi:hypothetical protein